MTEASENIEYIDSLIGILAGWFDDSAKSPSAKNFNWERILNVAQRTKTEGLIADGLSGGGMPAPPDVLNRLKAVNSDILKSNLGNFAWSLKISNVFEQAGVTAVIYKGATRSETVYGSWGKRRSADIDVTVPKHEFKKAMNVLRTEGFLPMINPKSRWWSEFLGEVPFQHPEASHLHIDLHHELQQPGGPYPRDLEGFFDASRIAHHSGKAIRHFSPAHELLITVISYAKAIKSGEPWLSYAHELIFTYLNSTAGERASVLELAEKNGVSRLYADAMTNAFALFGMANTLDGFQTGMPKDIAHLKLSAAGLIEPVRFFRSAKLWSWQDGSFPQRVYGFIKQKVRVYQSEFEQRRESGLTVRNG